MLFFVMFYKNLFLFFRFRGRWAGGRSSPSPPLDPLTAVTIEVPHDSVPLAKLFPTEPRKLSKFLHSPAESVLFSLLTIFPDPPDNVAGF